LIIQFLDAFNDIQVKRYEADGTTVRKLITVPVKLSTKEKFYYWYNNRKDDEMLPTITAWLTTIDFATDRQVNSFFEMCSSFNEEDLTYQKFLHPVPYNFTFTMSIWSLHMTDIDQILEQILPFFAPYIFIRMKIDELNVEHDVKVVFQNATPEVSWEMADEEYRIINYSLDFQAQAWLFKPVETTGGIIEKIYTNYITTTDAPSGTLTTTISGGFDDSGAVIYTYTELGAGAGTTECD
jgi:hypothetical protein